MIGIPPSVTIVRRIKASPARVYAAITEPEQIQRFAEKFLKEKRAKARKKAAAKRAGQKRTKKPGQARKPILRLLKSA